MSVAPDGLHGVIVIDKPSGVTSHDVVAIARRELGDTRIGHTGTLDPLATGVLPLACGRATRLVRFLTASDKDYEATIRFGVTTDSYDVTGAETGRSGRVPAAGDVEGALAGLTGEYLQTPPDREKLKELIAAMGIPVRALLRQKGTPYDELGLQEPTLSDEHLLNAMLAHPILINRPIVVTPLGVRLCRPSEAVLDLLPALPGPFAKEDGELVIDAQSQRVV